MLNVIMREYYQVQSICNLNNILGAKVSQNRR